jgi:hypothetical protein
MMRYKVKAMETGGENFEGNQGVVQVSPYNLTMRLEEYKEKRRQGLGLGPGEDNEGRDAGERNKPTGPLGSLSESGSRALFTFLIILRTKDAHWRVRRCSLPLSLSLSLSLSLPLSRESGRGSKPPSAATDDLSTEAALIPPRLP